jgi:hypothetical protein
MLLTGFVTLDGSGQQVLAVTNTTVGRPIRFSVARTSAGVYTITLMDKWAALVGCHVMTLVAGATPANRGGVWKVDSAAVTGSTPTVVIRNELAALAGAAGVAVDPPNNSVLLITLIMDQGKIAR